MTIVDLAVRKKSYRNLASQTTYPFHDSQLVLEAFDPTQEFSMNDLNTHVEKGVQGGAPNWYSGWPKEQEINAHIWHRPMIRNTTVGEKAQSYFDKVYVLEGDVQPNGDNPLAFTWPQRAFSKTDPVKVPKLETWLTFDALEQDQSKQFVMEDISEEDPDTAYDLLVSRKRMPIPKEFLDICWEGSSPRKVLRLAHERIKELAGSEEPEKIAAVAEKFGHFVDHWRMANTVIGRNELSKNVGEPHVLTTTQGRQWVSGVVKADLAGLDSEDSPQTNEEQTLEMLTKTLAAVEESNKTTKHSVESLSEAVVAGIQGQAATKVLPNTVEKKWPSRLDYLKKIAGVTTSTQLPKIWHEIAKCKNHEAVGTVQALLDAEADHLNLNLEFIVSARVIKSLVAFEFCSRGDLEKGLNIFNSVCFQHFKNAAAINDFNRNDQWLTGEKTTAKLEDYQSHEKIKHATFPQDTMQFREMVTGMWVFYRVTLGPNHPLTLVFAEFAKSGDALARRLASSNKNKALERFLFGIHSRIDRYFERLVRPGTVADQNLPDLNTYVESCYHGGALPEVELFAGKVAGPGLPEKGKLKTKNKDEKDKKSLGASVANPDMQDDHKYGGRTTTELIKKGGDPPKHDNGKDICLIWHTKGNCKEHCERKHSHCKLTDSESQKLKDYVQKE